MFYRKTFFATCRVIFVLVCSLVYRAFPEVLVFSPSLETNISELEFDLHRGPHKARHKLCRFVFKFSNLCPSTH